MEEPLDGTLLRWLTPRRMTTNQNPLGEAFRLVYS